MTTESTHIEKGAPVKDIVKVLLGDLGGKEDVSTEHSQTIYKIWAEEGSYDTVLEPPHSYTSPFIQAAKMSELFPHPEKPLVLDIGAGTGIVGDVLKQRGFKNLHALEPLKEFADDAMKKGIYDKIMVQFIGGGSSVSCPDDTYDAIVSCGAFAPGHIPIDAFHEIIRVIKRGGYWVNNMRNTFLRDTAEYRDRFVPLTKKLEEEGKWRKVSWETYPNHTEDDDGVMMVFQIC